ncbi:hypothetical protein [Streptomyces canus]|uniref:hypothetical protein n=1 Tax=Streptomyces canus TaxID=58343 RepID=UPI003830AB2B
MKARPLDERTVTALVTAATAAPSLHNAQPWQFRWRSGSHTLELRADLGRAMPRTDPDHRALHLGCGAVLFNLRVAAAHSGLHTRTQLLPDPHLLATVTLDDTGAPDHEAAPLFPAIDRRHTSRHPFEDRPIPADVEKALRNAAAQDGARLLFPGAWHVGALLDHLRDAEGRDTCWRWAPGSAWTCASPRRPPLWPDPALVADCRAIAEGEVGVESAARLVVGEAGGVPLWVSSS